MAGFTWPDFRGPGSLGYCFRSGRDLFLDGTPRKTVKTQKQFLMPSVDNATLERLRRSTVVGEDVWFLSGSTQAGDTVRHLPIDDHPYVIGRKSGVALKLQFKTVSGNHASMWVEDGRLYLKDLNSTNGTYVNGSRLEGETVLGEEDLIHFAEAPFRVLRQSPTGQTAGTLARNVCDEALALVQFDRMMSQKLVRPHFQPIVKIDDADSIGFEVLGRGSVFWTGIGRCHVSSRRTVKP